MQLCKRIHRSCLRDESDCFNSIIFFVNFSYLDINECLSAPCRNNGKCIDGFDGHTCLCMAGYTGHQCETSNRCVLKMGSFKDFTFI